MGFPNLLISPSFLPHGTCYLWNPQIVWLHVISDGLITISYYCIPIALIYLVNKRRDLPFNWIFWMFGLFILGCGTTHLMEVWTVWHPTYLLSGLIKAITAAVSIATAIVLLQLLPKAVALPSVDQLYSVNRELERQVNTRVRREQELTGLIEELELRVKERTAALDSINQSLEREIAIGVGTPLRRWTVAGTAVALLATGFMGFVCWRSVVKAAKDADWVSHTQEVRSSLEATLRHVDDIETGTRAFEMRGEESLLKPYLGGQRAIAGDIENLRLLTADNPSQRSRLATLESQVNIKVEYSREMIAERRRTGTLAQSATFVESDRLMNRVRGTVVLLDGVERALLDQRTDESLVAQRRTRNIIVLTTLASIIFLALAGSAVGREAKLSAQLRGQLKKINADLEQRVEQRTSALQESEARLSGVIESAKDAILTIDEEQRILLFNGAAEQMFGCDASEVLGHSLDRFIPERFRAAHAEHIGRFGNTGVTTRTMGAIGQLWGLRTDGAEFPIEASISQTEAGGRKLFTVILRDVTERKQADEVRERLAAVVESSEDAIISKTLEGTINAWNPGAEKLFGYSSSEAVGKPMLMLIPPERAYEESDILARIRSGEGVDHFETVRVRKDGKKIDISATISPLRDRNGVIVGASQIARDITERKRAEDALRESFATSQAALKELGDQKFALDQHAIVAITDVQGNITYVNEKFCAISKYSKEELIGQNHRILNSGHHPKDFFKQMYQTIANGKVWHDEIKNRAKDGSIYWVDTTIVPFMGANGKPRQYVAIRADITERKRAEEAFQESLIATEAALKELADQKFALDQHAIVAITDVQGTITYVNDKFCAISKYSREELIGQNHRILNSGHHPRDFFKQMYQTIANGKVWHNEIKNRAKDGSHYWVDTTIVPFVGANGKPRQYVAIRADITERKQGEEALHESQERFRLLLDGVKDYAIYMLDPPGHVISWNAGAARIKGYENEEILGKHFSCFYTREDRETDKPSRELQESLAKGRFEEQAQRVRKDGSAFWANVVITPMYDDHGVHKGFSKVARDITERKRAEDTVKESLAASEAALKELADQKFALDQHAIVAITDVQGTITYVNDKFCAISKYSREELIGQNHRILNSGHHPKEFFQQMYRAIANGKVWHNEIKNRAKDGSLYWVDTTIVPFLGAQGKPRQYVAIRADITERKLAAEALAQQAAELYRQAEQRKADEQEIRNLNDELEHRVIERTSQLEAANKELEAFTYSVSHDLRAPLRHIAGFSKMLAEESGVSLPPEAQHYLQRIQDGTRRMGTLVDDLLNLARIGRHELRLQVTGLDSIVKDVIADLAPDLEGRKIEWRIGKLPYVEGDPALLKVVFQNLLSNAVKYTRPRADAIIEVSVERVDGEQVVCVRDNGVGFNMNYADKLFGVFQRLHRAEDFEGTGVGLATVQRIVQKHGGRIWAQAELDKGAAFYVTFGKAKPAGTESKAAMAGEIS